MRIKVLVVENSTLVRQVLCDIIRADTAFLLVGAAPDAHVAKQMVQEFRPDVIALDVEMPKVSGVRFLEVMMKAMPTPVVMISALSKQKANDILRALELGAVDYMAKPKIGITSGDKNYSYVFTQKLKAAARSTPSSPTHARECQHAELRKTSTAKVIGIGASTGGAEAIKDVIMHFPCNAPATVMSLHMPPGFTTSYAHRLNQLCKIAVKEAKGGEQLLPGNAYLAPGNRHLMVEKKGANYWLKLDDGPKVTGHKPSVDVMFSSLAKHAKKNAVSVLLTGMGKDGAKGMAEMKQAGAVTFCQDKNSSLIYGMPRVAIELGAATHVVSLSNMSDAILDTIEAMSS
jgi:two-component system chemotaxis response regulator CheB